MTKIYGIYRHEAGTPFTGKVALSYEEAIEWVAQEIGNTFGTWTRVGTDARGLGNYEYVKGIPDYEGAKNGFKFIIKELEII